MKTSPHTKQTSSRTITREESINQREAMQLVPDARMLIREEMLNVREEMRLVPDARMLIREEMLSERAPPVNARGHSK